MSKLVEVNKDLHKRVKKQAVDEECHMKDLVEEALEEYLDGN